MGQCWGTCLKRGTKKKDTRSPYKIMTYFMEGISEFVIGLFSLVFMAVLITFYVGIAPDPTNTVVETNQKNAILLTTFGTAAVTVFGFKGSFGVALKNVFGNAWFTILAFVLSLMDARIRTKDMWLVLLPLVYIGLSIAGCFAGGATFTALYPTITVPTALQPVLANAVQGSYLWSILIGSIVYLAICHVFIFTMNGTRDKFSNLIPLFFTTFIGGTVLFSTTRLLPNFILNLGYSFITGHYELLWVDVVCAFIGIVLTVALYYFLWSPVAEPDQILQFPSFNIPFDFSVTYAKQGKEYWYGKKHKNIEHHWTSGDETKME